MASSLGKMPTTSARSAANSIVSSRSSRAPRTQAGRPGIEKSIASRSDPQPSPPVRAPRSPAARPAVAATPRSACDLPSGAAPGPEPRPLRYPRSPRPRLLRAHRHPSQHLHRPQISRLGCLKKPLGRGNHEDTQPFLREHWGAVAPTKRQSTHLCRVPMDRDRPISLKKGLEGGSWR